MTWLLISFLAIAAGLALDDMFVDFIALFRGLRPTAVEEDELKYWRRIPQKNIAVIVANWHEHNVIERMLRGNLSRLDYARVWLFVGVYPNDDETVKAAARAARGDARINVVENSMPGPTTKGQMLNVIFRRSFEIETQIGVQFDLFLMHDSEDVLHPQSLLMINAESTDARGKIDFLQIPVFSFPREASKVIGSTYIDEFAEIHTKDLLVRDHLKAGIPSAGVGTAISRRLVLDLMNIQGGSVLNETSLTEDYILGLTAAHMGYRSKFVSRFIPQFDRNGKLVRRDFIATREYFPSDWGRAVRQKGRWVHGIVLQGPRILKFNGSLARRYFLMRDRKGPVAALVGVLGIAILLFNLVARTLSSEFHETHLMSVYANSYVIGLFALNLSAGVLRAWHRAYAVWLTQDLATACLSVLRIPIGNLLNFASAARAVSQDRRARSSGSAAKWTKTIHELPADFGIELHPQPTEASKQVQL